MTQDDLKDILYYDYTTGIFTWKKNIGGRSKIGNVAGYKKQDGYIAIKVLGKRYFAHRLAWFYAKGTWPKIIDHDDHNKSNNIFTNLVDNTHKYNMKNSSMSKNNTSGHTGISILKSGKYSASIKVDGKSLYLGSFKIIDDAIAARKKAEIKHGFHKNHGK